MGRNPTWAKWERRVAALFGGQRRGASTSRNGQGLSDVIGAHGWSIECKLLGRVGYSDLLQAALQAERAAGPNEEPVAVVKLKGLSEENALVIQRLSVFCEWRL